MKFFIGGFKFLDGGLEFLVGRFQFLVARLQFFGDGFQFLMRSLKVLLNAPEMSDVVEADGHTERIGMFVKNRNELQTQELALLLWAEPFNVRNIDGAAHRVSLLD